MYNKYIKKQSINLKGKLAANVKSNKKKRRKIFQGNFKLLF